MTLLIAGCGAPRPSQEQQVDALARPLIEGKIIVGCVVGVVEDGKASLYTFGETKRGSGQKPDGQTVFEIGSITKTFTGLLLADMVRRGEVTLETPLADVMPEGSAAPHPKGRPITLVDLASQTAGLPKVPDNFAPANPRDPYADYTAEKLYDFLRDYTPPREPGKYEYSNLGVGLLGHVLAAKLGQPYDEVIAERITGPLGMHDTCIKLSDEQTARLAAPYLAGGSDGTNWSLAVLAPAGGLRSTGDDFLKLLTVALADDKDLSAAARPVREDLQLAWQRRYGELGEIGVGLCWHLARDGVTWFHDGQTGSYSAVVFIHPPKKLGVFVLANTAAGETSALGERIAQSLLGIKVDPVSIRATVDVDPAVLKSYVGAYLLSPINGFTITLEDNRLMAQLTGQDKHEIFAQSPTEFFYRVVDAEIEFVPEKDGTVKRLILHQNGGHLPALKISSGTTAR